jgi:hypothetical protein
VPGDAAIAMALQRVIEHPPQSAPVLEFNVEREAPDALVRVMWLDSLPELVRDELPVADLLEWLLKKHPERTTPDLLAGFSELVFHRDFQAVFSDQTPNTYTTPDGEITASPLVLTAHE